MDFTYKAHSVFALQYHLILVSKYRRTIFTNDISERARQIFERIAPDYGIDIVEWNHDLDHVHILMTGQPNSELGKFINAYKSASSRLLKKEFPQIKQMLWKEMLWSRSYCILSCGGAPIELIRQYIAEQGEHDDRRRKSVQI